MDRYGKLSAKKYKYDLIALTNQSIVFFNNAWYNLGGNLSNKYSIRMPNNINKPGNMVTGFPDKKADNKSTEAGRSDDDDKINFQDLQPI